LPTGSDFFGVRFFWPNQPLFCFLSRVNPILPRLFVYGTLRQATGHEMAGFLARGTSLLGPARVRGRLYNVTWYPGMVEAVNDDEWVHGDVYELASPAPTLAMLDRYEGCAPEDGSAALFERRRSRAVLQTGETLFCWAYFYLGPVQDENRILSGDYFLGRPPHRT
jgi:gamma-glutamylcyclotransferase (GGCT)/AIG2-like uncharacterized protein YtfP